MSGSLYEASHLVAYNCPFLSFRLLAAGGGAPFKEVVSRRVAAIFVARRPVPANGIKGTAAPAAQQWSTEHRKMKLVLVSAAVLCAAARNRPARRR